MTQPDPNWNPPRGPRSRYPHRRGHVQASSDPNPAPQILQPQSQHTESIRNAQRNSDPFQYDTQTMPYWDDASGAIHDISNATPLNLDRAYAKKNFAGQTGTTHGEQQQQQDQVTGLQTYGQHQWHNPYAEIVGGGPYAQNPVTHPTSSPPKNTSRTAIKDNKSNRRDFTPYFDAADPRNHTDLKSPDKYNFLGTKDVNQKLRQDTTDAIKLATEKRGKSKAEQPLPPLPEHEPKTTVVKRKSAPLPPILPRFAFENPTIISGKLAKSRTASVRKSAETSTQYTTPLSAINEAPSPLSKANKRRSVDRTPTLDRVLALRAEEQAKTLAKLEGDIQEDKPTDDGERHIPRELVKRISDSESRCIPRVTSREEKRHASEFVPGMQVPGVDEREGGCVMDDPAVQMKKEEVEDGAGSSVYGSEDNAQEDEIEKLTKAIAGLKPFQDLPPPSSSPKKKAFERQSAVPVGLDVAKLGKGKGGLGDGAGSKTKPEELGGRTQVEAEAELLKVLNATDEGTGKGGAGVGTSQENSSAESFATVSSDDYEQIRAEDELASEQNGVKRRWYKGFRKV
ncbi:uncharacterized protein J4E84_002216 [Alternaria hordeiaustralica]|uniref:uncharacterized protein n=1 Tax=Alternaria hordeiaustralica TaxID=1187925 RepID=UPI0020C561A9|nr:uncharacterized protein J4E84_002216 [Alternaria hordeiaustralica]KAI4693642.1 hypothetical protein J4E84_002216 [Alternaria hordeiaustralica]